MILILPFGEFFVKLMVQVPSALAAKNVDVSRVTLCILFAGDLDDTCIVHPVCTHCGSNMTEDGSSDAI